MFPRHLIALQALRPRRCFLRARGTIVRCPRTWPSSNGAERVHITAGFTALLCDHWRHSGRRSAVAAACSCEMRPAGRGSLHMVERAAVRSFVIFIISMTLALRAQALTNLRMFWAWRGACAATEGARGRACRSIGSRSGRWMRRRAFCLPSTIYSPELSSDGGRQPMLCVSPLALTGLRRSMCRLRTMPL